MLASISFLLTLYYEIFFKMRHKDKKVSSFQRYTGKKSVLIKVRHTDKKLSSK